ncbi:MAG: two-component sensor histidine kinase, partial [Rhizobiales bacterium]|nr:two-component sensor histidine kinase [Hyphomicrobiales bacterium]
MATQFSSSGTEPRSESWPDRLRRSAIVLLGGLLGLTAGVVFGGLTPAQASLIFLCVVAASL